MIDAGFSDIDSGPIYKETLYGRWPVEPFNTITTLFFLILVVYWWLKIKPHFKENLLITLTVPVIGVGFVGGFLYHSLRNHTAWLYLDWGPIFLTANIAAIYFWRTLTPSLVKALLFTYVPLLLALIIQQTSLRGASYLSLSYFFLVMSVVLPVGLYVRKYGLQYFKYVLLAITSIALALSLRILDRNALMDWLPMGSHFLWHTFGVLTCHFLISYVYLKKPKLI